MPQKRQKNRQPNAFWFAIFSLFFISSSHAQDEIATGSVGGGEPHNNMQPYLAVWWAIATDSSVFDADPTQSNRILGEIRAFTRSPIGANNTPIAASIIPTGWMLADGRLLDVSENQDLFDVIGNNFGGDGVNDFALPDLRGRTPRGVGTGPGLSAVALGEVSGSEAVRLSLAQSPSHTHPTDAGPTPSSGGGESHSNLMPTLGLHCLVATEGMFPTRSKPAPPDAEPQSPQTAAERLLGEIRWYAGTDPEIAPWTACDGEELPINNNQALFSLFGTIYGGDGRTDFALPDLRGRIMLHQGDGPGLPDFRLGRKTGAEEAAISNVEMPAHSHPIIAGADDEETGSTGSGVAHNNLQPATAVNALIALAGNFPPDANDPESNAFDGTITSELSFVGMNFAPRTFSFLDGALLTVSGASALFSLVVNQFGGDFMNNTFALPESRGRALIGVGAGPGLTERMLADSGGVTTHTLSEEEMPRHRHGDDDELCVVIPTANNAIATPCL